MTSHIASPAATCQWYALWTKSRHEKTAASTLGALGIAHYLPLQSELRQWTDRKQTVEVPLFPGYLFVHIDALSKSKLDVLKAPGVVGFVGNSTGPLPIPEREIESVRKAVLGGATSSPDALFKEGDRVRVIRGALAGVEGTLIRFGAKFQLVITIEMIQRSVTVMVSEQDVEAVEANPVANPIALSCAT